MTYGFDPDGIVVPVKLTLKREQEDWFVPDQTDELAEVERWAADRWGTDSRLYRDVMRFAAHRCPDCETPLVPSPGGPTFRRCPRCVLDWFAQWHEDDGRVKPGSRVYPLRISG